MVFWLVASLFGMLVSTYVDWLGICLIEGLLGILVSYWVVGLVGGLMGWWVVW